MSYPSAFMELILLGTAAAEGWPAPFCTCGACEEARRRGGPNVRSRPNSLIDHDLKIDYNADVVMQMQRFRRNLTKLRCIVITHPHADHLIPVEMLWASGPFTNTPPAQPIIVYGNQKALDQILRQFPEPLEANLDLRPMRPLEPFTTPMGDTILPLPADHAEDALLLRITRRGKSLFHGHDSGLYPQATLDALSDGVPLHIAVLDCTYGADKTNNRAHMGVDGVAQMTEELRRRGAITDTTRVVATHFSHNGKLLHEELCQAFLPHRIEVAFDGMVVRV